MEVSSLRVKGLESRVSFSWFRVLVLHYRMC